MTSNPAPKTRHHDGHDHARTDRAKLRRREGHCSCALCKTGNEERKPGRSAHRNRQGPGWIDARRARDFVRVNLTSSVVKRRLRAPTSGMDFLNARHCAE
jgi:hypothetical protein